MRLIPCLSLFLLAATPVAAQDYVVFTSPSGNILCGIFDDDSPGARCDMRTLTPSYTTPPADCEQDWGAYFWIGAHGRSGELICVGDIVADPESAPVLSYGRHITFAGVTCQSEESGVTCTNAAGHGFTIAKANQRIY